MKKIAIIGAGAVGCYYGAKIALSPHFAGEVHFLLRSDYETVRERGIRVLSPDGNFVLQPANAHRASHEIGVCDLVVIALKATANRSLLEILPPLLHADTLLLTLQNGLDNEEFLSFHFGSARVLGGKCFVCLNRIAPGVIQHIGHGIITMGEYLRTAQERTHALANLFRQSGIPCEVSDDIKEVLWRKLTWNIPFNGLSIAGGGIDVGRIISNPALLQRTRDLMREVIAIAAKEGVLIEPEYIEFQIERTRPMGAYKPSSLLDYEAGREVEIEPIWGQALRRARNLNVHAPRLEELLDELRTLT